jgi:glycosyltransferase involved in cell wall biosynthesis
LKTGVIAFPLDRPVAGGIDRYVHRLAREFHLGPAPGDFLWIHGEPFTDLSTLMGAREALLPEHGIAGALARRRWSRANPEEIDVMLGPYFGVLPGPFRKVMTVHDLYAFTSRDAGAWWTWRFRAATRRMAAMCDYIVADSDASRRQVIQFLGTPAERVVTVHLGVDPVPPASPKERAFSRAELRKRLQWPQDAKVVLFVGALIPRKDPMTLYRAFQAVHEKRPDARLLMMGRFTPATPAPLKAISNGTDPVALQGAVAESELAFAYEAADLLVLPSLFEGFGLPVLEAMSYGVPVACTNAGALAEIGEGAAAMFAPGDVAALASTMERVLFDEAESRRMAEAGLRHAKQFTWAKCAAKTYEVLERAAAR